MSDEKATVSIPTDLETAVAVAAAGNSKVITEYFIFLLSNGNSIADDDVFSLIDAVEKIKTPKDTTSINLCIDSGGGDIYSGVKIMNILREKCSSLKVTVLMEAKSTATIMALAADEIIMAPHSALGPLDKPMFHPHLKGEHLSALDILGAQTYLEKRAFALTREFAEKLMTEDGVLKEEAYEIASKLALGLITPILSKEDPRMINKANRLLRIAQQYGTEYLKKYTFSSFGDDLRNRIADVVMNFFIWDCPDHAFDITREKAKDNILNVTHAEDYKFWPYLWNFYKSSRKGTKVLTLLSEKEITSFI